MMVAKTSDALEIMLCYPTFSLLNSTEAHIFNEFSIFFIFNDPLNIKPCQIKSTQQIKLHKFQALDVMKSNHNVKITLNPNF